MYASVDAHAFVRGLDRVLKRQPRMSTDSDVAVISKPLSDAASIELRVKRKHERQCRATDVVELMPDVRTVCEPSIQPAADQQWYPTTPKKGQV
jgi:hypothetical protein